MAHTVEAEKHRSGRDGCDPEFLRRAGGRATPARPDQWGSTVRSRDPRPNGRTPRTLKRRPQETLNRYAMRKQTVEPVFGRIKDVRGAAPQLRRTRSQATEPV